MSRRPPTKAQKAIDLYVKEHEKDLPPGVKIELMRRDDTSNPEVGKRLAQELITRDHVQLLTGVVLSPVAAAIAPLTAEAKVPLLISIAAGGVAIPRISPYVARVSFTLWQQAYPIGKWAAEQGWKTGYTAVSDFIPGHDSEAAFTKGFTDGGGKIVGSVRLPPSNPDFAPFVQRIKDAKPDVVFIFVPAGTQATAMMKAMQDLGLREAGINVIAPQDLLPDEELPGMGDAPLGLITSGTYSADGEAAGERGLSRRLEARIRRQVDPRLPLGRRLGRHGGDLSTWSRRPRAISPPTRRWRSFKHWKNPDSPRGPIMIDPGDARHRPEHLYPPRREAGRQARQCRDRDDPDGQGPVEGAEPAEVTQVHATT